jgi:hypothetical protein
MPLICFILFFWACGCTVQAEARCTVRAEASGTNRLLEDLLVVDYWNAKVYDRWPLSYNFLLQAGYLAMPSALMSEEGEIALGWSYLPPYRLYNLRVQPFPQLEVTGSYRVFKGVKDPVLSPFGFGDFADKGANFKLALFQPEESNYHLPGLAIGIEDCIGTRSFYAKYLVLTKVWTDLNLEVSLGYGTNRLRGLFGGVHWMPFRPTGVTGLKELVLCAEYDATAYRSSRLEPHPKGRIKKSPLNFGIKWRLLDYFDFSAAWMRGDVWAFSASGFYNFGTTEGFLPKINMPLPYAAPVNFEPLGRRRSEQMLIADLLFPFQEQRLDILELSLYYTPCLEKGLHLTILNETYWAEAQVRCRLNSLLGALIPADIEEVLVVVESEGFPIQEYHYRMRWVREFHAEQIGEYELNVLTPMQEVQPLERFEAALLFERPIGLFNFEVTPKTHTLFGSSRGKFKYSLGLHAALNGFLSGNIYYSILLGCTFFTNLTRLKDYDRLNPSQLINVQTDLVNYYKQKGVTLDQAYLQKNWNLGDGCYARVAGGYFEEMYGGAAAELLYCPLVSPVVEGWAAGIEGAVLKKRTTRGLGFTKKIRKLKGFIPTYCNFLGSQYFFNLYYDLACFEVSFKISAGKFLANDWGVRTQMTRYFPSGMELHFWYTWTNGHDHINGKTYFDKGVYVSMPLDIFYTYSERTRFTYGMSAWLRDVGFQSYTGKQLYDMINEQRQ